MILFHAHGTAAIENDFENEHVNFYLKDDERTAQIMAVAKDALIGFAASSATRPGQLPCPDTNNHDSGI